MSRHYNHRVGEFRNGNGADWLDFLVTQLGRYREVQQEYLSDAGALRTWLSKRDLAPAEAPSEADVLWARELREALHETARAALREASPPAAAQSLIESALAEDKPLRLRRSARGLQVMRPRTAREALARLARQAIETLGGPQRAQLHACGDTTCAGIFLDANGRRRWCSDERCGNRARVRAHRARARAES